MTSACARPRCRYSSLVGLDRPSARKAGTEVKQHPLHCQFRQPCRCCVRDGARQRSWGTKAKPPRTRPAGGFAVCGLSATLARYFEICKRQWVDRPVGVDQDTRASSLADFPQLRRLAGHPREPLSFARFASSQSNSWKRISHKTVANRADAPSWEL